MSSKQSNLPMDPGTKCGNITACGYFITEKPHTVRCMAITGFPPMADERRGLLTEREREIISGEADVNDEYYYSVVSRVRGKINNIARDAKLLQEHHPDLSKELREAVSAGSSEETDE